LSGSDLGVPWPALWTVVLLGRYRHPRAAFVLEREMGLEGEPYPWTALAAAEALAGYGRPTVAALDARVRIADPLYRLYAYASLGWTGTAEARLVLLDALTWERDVVDAVACALADAGCTDA